MTKSKLKAINPKAAEPSKPKILIYGKPGVGKTWGALDFPSCFYIDTEGGADLYHYTAKLSKSGGMYLGPDQGSLSFETILEQVQALATEKHEFRTLIIDSITKIFNQEIANEAERLGSKNAFGADKKPALAMMRKLVSWLQRLDMNVILIAHEKPSWGIDDKGDRAEIGTTFDAWEKLEYELHLCLNIIKILDKRLAKVKKSRLLGFQDGASFPWAYSEFAERFGKDIIEKQSTQIILATPEQLNEINDILEIIKLPDGQLEKWLNHSNVSSLNEMDAEKIAKLINHLKEKFIPKPNTTIQL